MTTDTRPVPTTEAPSDAAPDPVSAHTTAASGATSASWRVWAGLGAMALTSLSLVSAEFLPGGLLTAMAADLGVTPGQAGQTVTVTALVGFVVAPLIGVMTPGVDRRTLLVVLAVGAALSNVIVAIAPTLWLLLLARLLLGAALSGFWSMSLTVAARIGGPGRVARSMTVVNAGTTLATVAGVPIGVVLSSLVGWRAAFVGVAVITVVTAIALRTLLPAVPAERGASLRVLWQTLLARGMRGGLAGHVLIVLGHMAAYAFIRVALERVPSIDAAGVAGLLLVFGAGGFVGNLVIGAIADRHLGPLRLLVPGAMAASILAVALWPGQLSLVVTATAVWGGTFGGWLVVINTWAGRIMPHRLEASGGLVVAGFQLAIALGAAVGGLLVDTAGVRIELLAAVGAVVVGGVLFGTAPSRPASGGAATER